MELKIPITKKQIKNHFTYAWWQYVLLLVIAVFGWNLIYTTTRYRSPEHLKVEWYGEGYMMGANNTTIDDLMQTIHQDLLPDMEEVTFTSVGYDETYGDMQLTVWTSTGQGDLYMLANDNFQNLAQNGAFVDLQPYIDSGALDTKGLDLTAGYAIDTETGKKYLMGVPTNQLQKLTTYGIVPDGQVMGLLINGGNIDNALKLMNYLIAEMQ